MALNGKKVLMIATAFFGYEQKMKQAMEELGCEVVFYDERSITSAAAKAALKISPAIFSGKTRRYYQRIVAENRGRHFDIVYIYGATMIDCKIVQMLKEAFPARYVLYLADSVLHQKRYEEMFPAFDVVATFDRGDYEVFKERYPNVAFLPLFFAKEYRKQAQTGDYDYDICFVGTIHSDRIRLLDTVKEQAEACGLRMYCYPFLPSRFIFNFYKLTKKEFRDKKPGDFQYDKLSAAQVSAIEQRSRALLDAQFPKNMGLTMRTIEAVGMQKKLITTNADVQNYDFYRPENILVVDRQAPEISKVFFQAGYCPIPEEIYEKYAITSWVSNLLEPGLKDKSFITQ